MNTAKCPNCGSQNTVFKQKAQQWECCHCESRFSDIQYESRPRRIFLSYPHAPDKHSQLVEDVAKVIEAKGHTPWFDKNKIKAGYDWRESITKGVLESDWMIIFMSQKSLAAGGVCLEEVGIALQKSGHETLLTVLLEDEKTVNPPISLTHVQWLDIKDFEEAYPKDRTNPDDMQKWEQWLDEKFTRLIRHIERKEDITGDINFLRNRLKPSSFVGQIAHSIKGFVGRQWIFDEIQNWQENQRESQTFVLEGAAGIGKSAIAGQLSQQLRDVIGIYFCKHNDTTTCDARNLVRTMIFQIASRDKAYRSWLQNKLIFPEFDGEKLFAINAPELFRELIVNAPRINEENKTRLILVIDGLDEARDENGKNTILELVSNEFDKLPLNVGVVITTRPELEITSRLASPHVLSTADSRNIQDITNYLKKHFDSLSVFTEHPDTKAQAVKIASQKSDGVMLYASELLRSIRANLIDPLAPDNFPEGLSGIYHAYMVREFKSAEMFHKTSAGLAELIAVSPLPLSEVLMRAVSGLTKVEFAHYIKPLSSLLVTGIRYSNTTYAPFHKSFADWLVMPKRMHDYRLEGDGLKRIGNFIYTRFLEQSQLVEFDDTESDWAITELLPICLPQMAIWKDADALAVLGDKLHMRGWYRAAIVPRTQVLAEHQTRSDKTDSDIIVHMTKLADTLEAQGDLIGASKLYIHILTTRQAFLDETHPDIVNSMNDLARTHHAMRSLSDALKLYKKVLATRLATLDKTHPETLISMNNVARILLEQGNFAEARAFYEQVLATRLATLNANHPDILISKDNLALTLYLQEDWIGAQALHEQVLSARQITLFENHPDTLASMNNLAKTLKAQGNLDSACTLYEQVLAARQATLGDVNPDTLSSKGNLAHTLYAKNDWGGAQALFEQVLAAYQAILGDTHPSTLDSMDDLAGTLYAQGDFARARSLYEQILAAHRATIGDIHPVTLSSMNNLAVTLYAQKDWAGSQVLFEKILTGRQATLDETHPDNLASICALLATLLAQDDLAGSLALVEKLLASQKITGATVPEYVLTCMSKLAGAFYKQGDFTSARALEEQVLAAFKNTIGVTHPDTISSMNNLVSTLFKLEDWVAARTILEQFLAAQKESLGQNHPDTLLAMHDLALTMRNLGELNEAFELCRSAYEGRAEVLGINHSDTLWSKRALATILFKQQKYEEASAAQEETLSAQKAYVGESDYETLVTMDELADTYEVLGRMKDAEALRDTHRRLSSSQE